MWLTPRRGSRRRTLTPPRAPIHPLAGADYPDIYGIRASGDAVSFKLVTKGPYDVNIGARTYVMDSPQTYKRYMVKNREFAFDVDVSALPCGLNGALYFVDMDSDGGASKYPNNKAGAAYGTGYCDAQCPHDEKRVFYLCPSQYLISYFMPPPLPFPPLPLLYRFINGEANIIGWAPDPNGDPNSGVSHLLCVRRVRALLSHAPCTLPFPTL